MRFLFAETSDTVDPSYDFERTRSRRDRRVHEDDEYPHEHMSCAPYDGILISRAAFTDHRHAGKYSAAKTMRFRREGARRFLRYPEDRFPGSMLMGDCGAFSYRDADQPTYSVDDTLEFYADGGFTHGCSVDHLIFDFDRGNGQGSEEARRRQEITLDLAADFITRSNALGRGFTPVGVIQGWSPVSMADAAGGLYTMGYRSLALGGMARADTADIECALQAVNATLGRGAVRMHMLGFGKIEDAPRLRSVGVTSFDTTSPLLRAFKDDRRNYFTTSGGTLDHYTAVRIPQASDDRHARRSAAARDMGQEALLDGERRAMDAVRDFAAGRRGIDETLDAVMDYATVVLHDDRATAESNATRFARLKDSYGRTLSDRPWEGCGCRVCAEVGVEAVLFRSSNHNKRRGFHNLAVFHAHLQSQECAK